MKEMRELNGGDIFTMLGIIGKLDIQDEVVELIERQYEKEDAVTSLKGHNEKKLTKKQQDEYDKAVNKRGMQVAVKLGFSVLNHVNDAKDDINSFLANLTSSSKTEIENLSFKDYTKLLFDFSKKPELTDFLTSISSFLA